MFLGKPTLLTVIIIILKASFAAVYPRSTGGVVSNSPECAGIGRTSLEDGGSAVDAAISTLFCEGVTMPHTMGLGGGFIMTIYIKKEKKVVTLISRETAPASATEDMFGGDANLSAKGGASVAIPGELMGYWVAHRRYGRVGWASLIEPSIDLCFQGYRVTPFLEKIFKNEEWQLRKDPGLRATFINPRTDETYKAGDYLKRPVLGETLRIIARDGAAALYDGAYTNKLVNDLKKLNGSLTADDMKNYKPIWKEPIQTELPNGKTFYAPNVPSSGPVLVFILNVLRNFLNIGNINSLTNWQRIVETFKYAYAYRTKLGDPDFVPGMDSLLQQLVSTSYATEVRENISDTETYNDPKHYGVEFYEVDNKGTANIVVLAPDGDAVSVTSTINQNFGSGILSPSTGIILNDEMDDFSAPNIVNGYGMPPTPANFIRPGKRPLSSMCPSVIVDKNGDVALVVGAAGGTKITTSVALVTMRYLWFKESIVKAVSSRRLHHQLFPMQIDAEDGFNQDLLEGLSAIGHNITISVADGFSAVTAIRQQRGVVNGAYDVRRGGSVSLYYSTFKH